MNIELNKEKEELLLIKDIIAGKVKITEEMRENWVESAMKNYLPKDWRKLKRFPISINSGNGEENAVIISKTELLRDHIKISAALKEQDECLNSCPGFIKCKRRGMTQCFYRDERGNLEFAMTLNCDRKREHEKAKEREKLFKSSKIPAKYANLTYNDYIRTEGNYKAYSLAVDFGNDNKKRTKGLYIYGNKGVGKTMLVSIIAQSVMDIKSVAYYSATKLAIDIKSSIDQKTTGRLLNELEEVDVLIIDDLGTETQKPWLTEQFYDIFDTRYQNELPIIVTSNLKPQQLIKHFGTQTQGERILDRIIAQAEYVEIVGKSRRMG